MKNQALFSLKDKSKKLKCRLLQFLFGTLRVNFFCNFIHRQHKLSQSESTFERSSSFLYEVTLTGKGGKIEIGSVTPLKNTLSL